MANALKTFSKLRICAHFCRTFHNQISLQSRSSTAQSYGNFQRLLTLSARNFSVGKDSSKNWNEDVNDDDGDVDEKSSKRKIRKRNSKFSVSQKGGSAIVRPSRYLFDGTGDGDDDGQWLKKSTSNKYKLEWYTKQLLFLMSENKVNQAQELFDSMKTKNIKPSVEMFNILIAGYGRIRKMRKAFHHYNNIKKMGLQPSGHTFTTLFNICSGISTKEVALPQLLQLWEEFQTSVNSKHIKPDIITYNAALKAAASCHNFTLAMDIYNDLCSNNILPESRTYSALLSACVEEYSSDKVQWILKEMQSHDIKPDIYVFNAILKALRLNTRKRDSSDGDNKQESDSSDVEVIGGYDMVDVLPNVEIPKSSGVFTGVEDFLQLMAVNDVIPDIRTFHLLLQVCDVDVSQEEYVLQVMKEWQFIPDLPILNALVKRRAFWGDINKAKEYIHAFKEEYGIIADKSIYHSLAKGCRRMSDGVWLLNEMKSQGYQPGIHVYIKLVKNATYHNAFQYLTELLKEMKKDHVQPTDELIQLIEEATKPSYEKDSKHISKHKKRDIKKKEFVRKQQFGFLGFYKTWKYNMTSLKDTEETKDNQTVIEKDSNNFEHL